VEEKLTTGLCEREIAKVIKRDEIKTTEIVSNAPLFASTCLALKPVDQINNVDEAAPETIADTGPCDGNGQRGFACACPTNEYGTTIVCDEGLLAIGSG
jgi:hypothetical protein